MVSFIFQDLGTVLAQWPYVEECKGGHPRCKLELLCLLTLIRMPAIVYDCEVFRAIIFIAEIRKPFM